MIAKQSKIVEKIKATEEERMQKIEELKKRGEYVQEPSYMDRFDSMYAEIFSNKKQWLEYSINRLKSQTE